MGVTCGASDSGLTRLGLRVNDMGATSISREQHQCHIHVVVAAGAQWPTRLGGPAWQLRLHSSGDASERRGGCGEASRVGRMNAAVYIEVMAGVG